MPQEIAVILVSDGHLRRSKMKGKKGVYIMLPLVLGIWVMIIYKVYKTINGNKENPVFHMQDGLVTSAKHELDTFVIVASYRDPFLDKIVSEQQIERKNNISNIVPKNTQSFAKIIAPWPSINYVGIIKNKKSSKQTILVQLNGKEMILKEGDRAEGLTLCRVYKDSIEFSKEKEK